MHRDVKPSNVLVRGHDEDEFAYLIDFGIARAASGMTSGPAITVTGATLGTLDYMAPERFENRPVDGLTDVYSLACMLFELLTGTTPFHGRTPIGMIHAHTSLDPPRPSARRAGLPQGLDGVVQRGMAKRPERRYPTAGALVAAARAVLRGSPTHTAASSVPAPPARGAHVPAPRPSGRRTPPLPTPPSQNRGTHTARPRTHGPHAQAPLSLQKAPPLSLRKAPSDQSPAPAAAGWRAPPPAPPRAPAAPWSPPTHPARPGGMVMAFVLQLVSGGIFLLGSLVSLIGGVTLALVSVLVAAFYIGCAIKAFGGRGWARGTLAVINALFGVFCLVVIPYGLTDASSTAGERVGGIFALLVLTGVAVACTLPMFTRRAKAYVAARRPRP